MASARATPREGLVPVSFVGFCGVSGFAGFCRVAKSCQNLCKSVLKVVHRSGSLVSSGLERFPTRRYSGLEAPKWPRQGQPPERGLCQSASSGFVGSRVLLGFAGWQKSCQNLCWIPGFVGFRRVLKPCQNLEARTGACKCFPTRHGSGLEAPKWPEQG